MRDVLRLFSFWSILVAIGNLCSIFGSFFFIVRAFLRINTAGALLGFGCFLTWTSSIRYLEHTRSYSHALRTIYVAIPTVSKTILGVLPIFIGYAFLGNILFYRSNRFEDMGISMFTLFAVMNGDMIFDTYHDLSGIHFLLAVIYVYSFIFIAIW